MISSMLLQRGLMPLVPQVSIPDPDTPDNAAADQHKRRGDEAFVRQAFAEVMT